MPDKKPKKEKENGNAEKESDADFFKRIMSIKDEAVKNATVGLSAYSKEETEARGQGAATAKILAEREECEKIVEEFKNNPPVVFSKNIGGFSVEYRVEDKYQAKVDLLRKNGFPFLHAVNGTSITPVAFNTLGSAYVKRGGRKALFPTSSSDAPFIIRDGDIIGTEDKSFVLELKDEEQDEENNYWHIFIFPNSELKIGIDERTTHPEPAYMEPEKVPAEIKKNSTTTDTIYSIQDIELLSGLFNLKIKRKNREISDLVRFASGFPAVEFTGSGSLTNELVKTEMEKAVAKAGASLLAKVAGSFAEMKAKSEKHGGDDLSAFVELCKDGSVVIFSTMNRIALRGSGKMTKKISTDMYNPVKITATKAGLYETDGKKNPDYRVTAIIKLWMAASSYAGFETNAKEVVPGMGGKVLDIEDAKKMLEYSKILGEKEIEKAAEEILKNRKEEVKTKKPEKEQVPDIESQKREAEEMLKNAEELGEPELVEVAKAQLKTAESVSKAVHIPGIEHMTLEEFSKAASEMSSRGEEYTVDQKDLDRMGSEYKNRNMLKIKTQIEAELPPYSSPIQSDNV